MSGMCYDMNPAGCCNGTKTLCQRQGEFDFSCQDPFKVVNSCWNTNIFVQLCIALNKITVADISLVSQLKKQIKTCKHMFAVYLWGLLAWIWVRPRTWHKSKPQTHTNIFRQLQSNLLPFTIWMMTDEQDWEWQSAAHALQNEQAQTQIKMSCWEGDQARPTCIQDSLL